MDGVAKHVGLPIYQLQIVYHTILTVAIFECYNHPLRYFSEMFPPQMPVIQFPLANLLTDVHIWSTGIINTPHYQSILFCVVGKVTLWKPGMFYFIPDLLTHSLSLIHGNIARFDQRILKKLLPDILWNNHTNCRHSLPGCAPASTKCFIHCMAGHCKAVVPDELIFL